MGCVCSKLKGGDSKKDSNVAYSPVKRDPTKAKSKPEGKKYQKLGADFDDHDDECVDDQAEEVEEVNITKKGSYSLLTTDHDDDLSLNAVEIKDTKEEEHKDQARISKDDRTELPVSTKESGNVDSIIHSSNGDVTTDTVKVELNSSNVGAKGQDRSHDSDAEDATENDLFITEDNDTCVSESHDLMITESNETSNSEVNTDADKSNTHAENVAEKLDTSKDNVTEQDSNNITDVSTVDASGKKADVTVTSDDSIAVDNMPIDVKSTKVIDKSISETNGTDVDATIRPNTEDADATENQPLLVDNADVDDQQMTKDIIVNEPESADSSHAENGVVSVGIDQDETDGFDSSKNLHINSHECRDESTRGGNEGEQSISDAETNGPLMDAEANGPLLVTDKDDQDKERHREATEAVCEKDKPRDTSLNITLGSCDEEQDGSENGAESQALLSPVDTNMDQSEVDSSPVDNRFNANNLSLNSENLVVNGDSHMNGDNEESSLLSNHLDNDNHVETIEEQKHITSPRRVHFEDENDNLHLQFSPTSVMNDNHMQESELTFEKAKCVVHAAMHYLKTCDNYTSDKACVVMKKLAVASCVISSIDSETRTHLANYLVQTGFAQLFVKIARSLLAESSTSQTQDSLKVMKGTCTNFSTGNEFESLVCELARKGAIDLLLNELDESYPPVSDHKLLHVVHTLNILSNCVRCSDGHVRQSYRNANGVSILMKYLTSNEIKLKLESLSILAYIVDDKECDLLATEEGLFLCLIDTLKEAVTADDYYVHYNIAGEPCGDGVYGLIDTLNRLVTNDSCKGQIVEQDGIPPIIQILQIQGADAQDSQLAALEALWKIAFIAKHQQILIQHILDSNVVPSKY